MTDYERLRKKVYISNYNIKRTVYQIIYIVRCLEQEANIIKLYYLFCYIFYLCFFTKFDDIILTSKP